MMHDCKNTENSQINSPLLEVRDLSVAFSTRQGVLRAVDGISFSLRQNCVTALVGESGCGKSVTARSIMRLPYGKEAQSTAEALEFRRRDGSPIDLMKAGEGELRAIRGNEISMIFQEPMSALNPVLSIGRQLEDVLKAHTDLRRRERRTRVHELITEVGIPDPKHFSSLYPHEISGGMRQRAVIAMALAMKPSLIIADEPTTALDVTIQSQIFALLSRLQKESGAAILLISHDLALVKEIADEVLVMYAGRIIESGSTEDIFEGALHPYTEALLKARPDQASTAPLFSIKGSVPSLINLPPCCAFRPRCERACEECNGTAPLLRKTDGNHKVACHLYAREEF